MNPMITFTYAWSRPYLPSGGTEKVHLYIEAHGIAPDHQVSDRMGDDPAAARHGKCCFQEAREWQRLAGQQVKLTLQPSDYMVFSGVYGLETVDIVGEKIINVGDIYQFESKSVLVELEVLPHRIGSHPILIMELDYTENGGGNAYSSFEVTAEFTCDPKLLSLSVHAELEAKIQQLMLEGAAKCGTGVFSGTGSDSAAETFEPVQLPQAGGRLAEAGMTFIRF